jgi:DNA invertase Pin-like site-specific DNA recombinase
MFVKNSVMATFFYSRISTVQQQEARQIENFKTIEGYSPDRVFMDKVSGKVPFLERQSAAKLFDAITSDKTEPHTLVIDSVDRMGRSLVNILETIELFTSNGVNIKSLKEGFETITNGQENPVAKMTLSFMASIAEFEKNRIKQRQSEGVAIAKANGKYQGRKIGSTESNKRILEKHAVIVSKLKKKYTIREIAEITKASTATIIKVKKAMAAQ